MLDTLFQYSKQENYIVPGHQRDIEERPRTYNSSVINSIVIKIYVDADLKQIVGERHCFQ